MFDTKPRYFLETEPHTQVWATKANILESKPWTFISNETLSQSNPEP